MEHFNGIPPKGVKEKNMYVLHLDTPRIVILCSVIIGVIVISFLLGMNLFKSTEKPEDMLAQKDKLMNIPLPNAGLDNKPGVPGEDNLLPPLDEPGKNTVSKDDKNALQDSRENHIASMDKNPGRGDILNTDNIKDILPPADENRKASAENPVKKTRKSVNKKNKTAKKQRVVEVAEKEKSDTHRRSIKNGFAVQVASFDSRSKAVSEIGRLKKLSYDAYIDKSEVKGKNYYRVRIGPIASKARAVELLNEIQENNRYEGSYLVKE